MFRPISAIIRFSQRRQHQRCNQETKRHPHTPHFTLASLDITNLYTNIPVAETRNIISNSLKGNLLDPQTQQELLNWYDVFLTL